MASVVRTAVGEPITDETLVQRVRTGDKHAYAELWKRHSKAGLTAARSFQNLAEPEDLVSEAFVQIFRTLQGEHGPTGAFRPYLYVTIRNLAMRSARHSAEVSDSELDLDTVPTEASSPEEVDRALDRSLTATAFRGLPERWQTVLWYTEVERMSPVEAATLMGITPNAVSALAYRARTALRSAWLQSHINEKDLDEDCRSTLSMLGEYSQGSLTPRQERTIRAHLRTCTRCSIVADEVDHVAGRLAVVMLPLLLGGSAAGIFGHALATSGMPPQASASSTPPDPTSGIGGNVVSIGAKSIFSGPVIAASAAAVLIIAGVATGVATGGFGLLGNNDSTIAAPLVNPDPVVDPALPTADPTAVPEPTALPTAEPSAEPTAEPTPVPESTPPVVIPPVSDPEVPTVKPDPLPSLAAPEIAGAASVLTNDGDFAVSGAGKPGARILIARGTTALGSTLVASSGAWSWTATNLDEGTNALSFGQSLRGYEPSTKANLRVVLDTVAPGAPTAEDTWTTAGGNKPEMRGSGEPGASVIIRTVAGVVLKTVIVAADGTWATGDIPGFDPTMTSLTATQTDRATNVSGVTTMGTFAFVPVILDPADNAEFPSSTVPVHFQGWPGTTLRINIDNNSTNYDRLIAASGLRTVTLTSNSGGPLAPGSYLVRVRYLGADGTTTGPTDEITINIVP